MLILFAATTMACTPSCLPHQNDGGQADDGPLTFDPIVKGCGEQCTKDVLEIVPKVIRILTGGERVAEQLDELGREVGTKVLVQAVDYAQHEMRGSAGAQNPDVLSAASRGDDYLKSRGTRVEPAEGPHTLLLWHPYQHGAAGVGFVPIERAPANPLAWHLVLSSARGTRS